MIHSGLRSLKYLSMSAASTRPGHSWPQRLLIRAPEFSSVPADEIFLQACISPSMQLQIKRTQRRHPIFQHLEHLLGGHSVGCDLEREVIGVLHLLGDAITQIAQRYQI